MGKRQGGHRGAHRTLTVLAALGGALAAAVAAAQGAYPPLGAYNVDPAQVSVSGFDSGADMAIQLGVAYSSRIMGVGAFAPTPYDCKRAGGITQNNCENDKTPNVATLEANMRRWSGNANDAVGNIARQRVYVFGGNADTVRAASVVGQAADLYGRFLPAGNFMYESSVFAKHVFPTDFDNPRLISCGVDQFPLANCNFDGAGATLQWIYGPLNPRTAAPQPGGNVIAFDQRAFVPAYKGMDELGFLYVPKSCAAGARCRLHVFLHGCGGSYFKLGEPWYANYSGHSRWAETNGIILLFPQDYPDDTLNPLGCWDNAGLYDDQFDQKGGTQASAIMAMVTKITSGFTGGVKAIEYHHGEWDHYFMTINPDEIAKLDSGGFAGWARTGESIPVDPLGTPGAFDVCRFFSTAFDPRSSHFYATSAAECAVVKQYPEWHFEGTVFGMPPPDADGNCGAASLPLFRLYNDGHGGAPNHRYTTSLVTRATMIAKGWIPEGAGPLGVEGCAPM